MHKRPFQRIHDRPAWKNNLKLKKSTVCVSLRSDVGCSWTTGVTGTTYGLVDDVLGAKEYEEVTNTPTQPIVVQR